MTLVCENCQAQVYRFRRCAATAVASAVIRLALAPTPAFGHSAAHVRPLQCHRQPRVAAVAAGPRYPFVPARALQCGAHENRSRWCAGASRARVRFRPLVADAVLGEGGEPGLLHVQRPLRNPGEKPGLSRALPAPARPGADEQFHRVAAGGGRQAALAHHQRTAGPGGGGAVGCVGGRRCAPVVLHSGDHRGGAGFPPLARAHAGVPVAR